MTNLDGDVAENILHVSNGTTDAWTAENLTTLLSAIKTGLTTPDGVMSGIIGNQTSQNTLTALVGRDLTTQNSPEVTETATIVGTDSGAPLPQGVSKAFTLRTGLSGRSFRGRVYQAGLTVNHQVTDDKDEMNATALGNFSGCWGAAITVVSGAGSGWYWGVLSRYYQTGDPPTTTRRVNGVITKITEVGYSHIAFDYQRRRAPLHARHF